MNKYIDAEKLKKSIGNYVEGARAALNPIDGDADYYNGKIDACKDMQEFITAFQQEQQEVDLEKIEKASYKVFPVKKKFGVEIKYPNREDENFSKREIWKNGVIWAIYELGLNARKEE